MLPKWGLLSVGAAPRPGLGGGAASCPRPQPRTETEALGAQAGGAVWDGPVPPEPQPGLRGGGAGRRTTRI